MGWHEINRCGEQLGEELVRSERVSGWGRGGRDGEDGGCPDIQGFTVCRVGKHQTSSSLGIKRRAQKPRWPSFVARMPMTGRELAWQCALRFQSLGVYWGAS